MKSYCLTVQVKSASIENGLGYMIAFSLPEGRDSPDLCPAFSAWSEEVKSAVLKAGDGVFSAETYDKKHHIAQLMQDLDDINKKYDIRIGGVAGVPAVQVHSTNPFDNQIEIDFTGDEGHFTVVEKGLADLQRSCVSEHGKTKVIEGGRKHFPFESGGFGPPKSPRSRPPRP